VDRIGELAEHHDTDEPIVIQRAVETGVGRLCRDLPVSEYCLAWPPISPSAFGRHRGTRGYRTGHRT